MTIQELIDVKEIHIRKLKAEIEELERESPFRKWKANRDSFHVLNPQSWKCRKEGWNACVDHLRTKFMNYGGTFHQVYIGHVIKKILAEAKEE